MKLILSSNDFSNDKTKKVIIDNLGVPLNQCRLLYIPNEKASEKQMKSNRFQLKCESFGFNPELVTVLNYYKSNQFRHLNIDAVYVSGGNTFSTLYRLKKHHFDDALCEYIRSGAVYIGGSCGAHIISKNIEHVLPFDENNTDMASFDALGLFDGILYCHYCKEREPYYLNSIKENKYHVYALPDGTSLVIEDGQVKFIE